MFWFDANRIKHVCSQLYRYNLLCKASDDRQARHKSNNYGFVIEAAKLVIIA